MMVLLPVYSKENFGILECQYGFILATNEAMVVTLQYAVTQLTKRFYLLVLVEGLLFYGLGVGSVGLGSSFGDFLASMVIVPIGEMIIILTAAAMTAEMAR